MPGQGSEVLVDFRDIETRKQEAGNFKREHLEQLTRHSEDKLAALVEKMKDELKPKDEFRNPNLGPAPKEYIPRLGLYRLSSNAIMPTHATKHSACWDVYSIEDKRLGETGGQWRFAPVRTGWRLVIPQGFRIDVRARSGLAAKQGVTVLNAPGTIDHDYKGELMIILGSLNRCAIDIKKGDRIAQIALERVQEFTVEEIGEEDLPVIDSDRIGGLGSSGK